MVWHQYVFYTSLALWIVAVLFVAPVPAIGSGGKTRVPRSPSWQNIMIALLTSGIIHLAYSKFHSYCDNMSEALDDGQRNRCPHGVASIHATSLKSAVDMTQDLVECHDRLTSFLVSFSEEFKQTCAALHNDAQNIIHDVENWYTDVSVILRESQEAVLITAPKATQSADVLSAGAVPSPSSPFDESDIPNGQTVNRLARQSKSQEPSQQGSYQHLVAMEHTVASRSNNGRHSSQTARPKTQSLLFQQKYGLVHTERSVRQKTSLERTLEPSGTSNDNARKAVAQSQQKASLEAVLEPLGTSNDPAHDAVSQPLLLGDQSAEGNASSESGSSEESLSTSRCTTRMVGTQAQNATKHSSDDGRLPEFGAEERTVCTDKVVMPLVVESPAFLKRDALLSARPVSGEEFGVKEEGAFVISQLKATTMTVGGSRAASVRSPRKFLAQDCTFTSVNTSLESSEHYDMTEEKN